MPRAVQLLAGAALAVLLVASPAFADSKMQVRGGVLYFTNEDAGIANDLNVDHDARGRLHFTDEADPYGMNYPSPPCSPGKINSAGNAVEVFCDKQGFTSVAIEVGPGEDKVNWAIDEMPATISGAVGADNLTVGGAADILNGGQGNDTLAGNAGNDTLLGDDGDDTLRGGAGDDRVNGGAGLDTLDGGDGNDTVQTADGIADIVECGAGEDTANADTNDQLANCEHVTRAQVAAPPGQSGVKDTTRPVVQLGGSTSQRVSARRRRLTLLVSVSERALVEVSGYLDAGGINSRLKPVSATVTVGGGGVEVRITLSKRLAALVTRDLRHKRRPRVLFTVSAADAAGNTSRSRHLTVALRR